MDDVFSQSPTSPDNTTEVTIRIDQRSEGYNHPLEARPTVSQQMEEGISFHTATLLTPLQWRGVLP